MQSRYLPSPIFRVLLVLFIALSSLFVGESHSFAAAAGWSWDLHAPLPTAVSSRTLTVNAPINTPNDTYQIGVTCTGNVNTDSSFYDGSGGTDSWTPSTSGPSSRTVTLTAGTVSDIGCNTSYWGSSAQITNVYVKDLATGVYVLDAHAGDAPALAAWCSTSDFGDIAASYVGTTLTVRFQWNNATLPSAGWTVVAPDPGTSTGSTGTIATSSTLPGYTNYYQSTFTVSSLSTYTVRVYAAANSGGSPGCYDSGTVSGNALSTPGSQGGDTGNDTQSSSNPNCGWSLNPFHYLKCLFEPSSSLQQWSDLENTAKTHPPISLVIGGIQYISDGVDNLNSGAGCGSVGYGVCPEAFGDPTYISNATAGSTHDLDLIGSAANLMDTTTWGQIIFTLEKICIYGFCFFSIWRLIGQSFGSKE